MQAAEDPCFVPPFLMRVPVYEAGHIPALQSQSCQPAATVLYTPRSVVDPAPVIGPPDEVKGVLGSLFLKVAPKGLSKVTLFLAPRLRPVSGSKKEFPPNRMSNASPRRPKCHSHCHTAEEDHVAVRSNTCVLCFACNLRSEKCVY